MCICFFVRLSTLPHQEQNKPVSHSNIFTVDQVRYFLKDEAKVNDAFVALVTLESNSTTIFRHSPYVGLEHFLQ